MIEIRKKLQKFFRDNGYFSRKNTPVWKNFYGKFIRVSTKTGWRNSPIHTVLLRNIKDSDHNDISDHLWVNYTNELQNLGRLEYGDIIEFHALVEKYTKGYINKKSGIDERIADYKLVRLTRFVNTRTKNKKNQCPQIPEPITF